MINRVVLVGRLTHDPELRKTSSGASVTNFSIAVNNRFARDQENSTSFFRVSCWNQTADFVAQYARKGNLVGVDGRIEQRSYVNNAGQKLVPSTLLPIRFNYLSPNLKVVKEPVIKVMLNPLLT